MRKADVGLTFVTVVAAGLLLESGDLHAASRPLERARAAPADGARLDAGAGSAFGLASIVHDQAAAVVAPPCLPRAATALVLVPRMESAPRSRPPRAPRARGPPVR